MNKPEIDLVNISDSYYNYREALEHMETQGCTHLGWVNSGITLPKDVKWERVFSNNRGTSDLYVDRQKRICYSVDCGD